MALFDNSPFRLLERSMDATALRQKVIANNIANVDTPNFKRSDVQFGDLLQQQLDAGSSSFVGLRTDPRHFAIGGRSPVEAPVPTVVTDNATAMNNNNNNVDIDAEMSSMAKNEIQYDVLSQQVSYELKQLRTAIRGGQ